MKTRIGHYDIVTELGRGGMGVVYKGHEASLNRYVAIKVLSPALAHDESVKERFLREARSMAALNDPHIIQVYFIGEDDGQPYFAMEFVEGESLSSYLKRETRMAPREAARAIYQTAQGLATAHDRGVVHRDIKPGNLMLDQKGRIKIADFGIAFQSDVSKKLTSTGEFVGTPGYLSPEVCTGQRVDQRSDIFSLGIVMFELLTGRMPFTDESPLGLLLEVVRAEIPDVRQLNAEVDAELTRILARMTAKDPANRYASCHELAAELAAHPHVAGQQTITAKPVLSPAASTVLGMKTPPAMMVGARAAAPAANAAGIQPGLSASAPPPVRASVLQREERQRGSGAWAIAAVLLLAFGVGAYAMRERLPMFASSDRVAATSSTSAADASQAPASAAGGSSGSTDEALQPGTISAPVPAAPQVANPSGASASSGGASSGGAAGAGSNADPATSGASGAGVSGGSLDAREPGLVTADLRDESDASGDAGGASASGDMPGAANDPASRETADARNAFRATRDEDAPASNPRAEHDDSDRAAATPALAALRRAADERRGAAADDRRALARNVPPAPPSEPRRPTGPPRIAVIAIGDPAVTGPAEQLVEDAIADAGLLLADEAMTSGVDSALRSGDVDLPRLFGALARSSNVGAVIVVRGEPLGSTPLTFYGQVDTLHSVALTVRGYDVESRSPLGSGLRAKVDFTSLNAGEKTEEALEPQLRRVVGTLSRYRARGAGG
ncbi:MAG TPA: serine/threonine-protein kinase [Candidatus Saccharimonadia bacterium]|nr:serine/threonine-protein kinase [Candidatus Saccharimonadia bacterium]